MNNRWVQKESTYFLPQKFMKSSLVLPKVQKEVSYFVIKLT
jgi:hypothetical protein